MKTRISFHDVPLDVYDAIDIVECEGERYVWKQLELGTVQLVFFPGTWRVEAGNDEIPV